MRREYEFRKRHFIPIMGMHGYASRVMNFLNAGGKIPETSPYNYDSDKILRRFAVYHFVSGTISGVGAMFGGFKTLEMLLT